MQIAKRYQHTEFVKENFLLLKSKQQQQLEEEKEDKYSNDKTDDSPQ